jgi:hypothetical protein
MFLTNVFKWLIKPPIIESPFVKHWEGEGNNPPPPKNDIIVTESGNHMVTELTDSLLITE